MEPRQVGPSASFEQTPRPEVSLSTGETSAPGHEFFNENRMEQLPAPQEIAAAPPVIPIVPGLPAPAATDDAAAVVAADATGTPMTAADEDLIEKEWVDRAKKIVEETKDDPYRREQEIGKLQRDYIKKRYGRDIGAIGG